MHPIVLAHGYFGFGNLGPFQYYNRVGPLIQELGVDAPFRPVVDPRGDLHTRSAQLAKQIEDKFHGSKVHLIAHSMGGLDARFMVSNQGLHRHDLVASLTTIGTPHRGTWVADLATLNFDGPANKPIRDVIAAAALECLRLVPALLLGGGSELIGGVQFVTSTLIEAAQSAASSDLTRMRAYLESIITLPDLALRELTTERCAALFNPDESDLNDIPAFSYAGIAQAPHLTPLFALTQLILAAHDGPNDGLVPLASATLKHTHMCTLNTDHAGLIGWRPEDVTSCYRQIIGTLRSLPG